MVAKTDAGGHCGTSGFRSSWGCQEVCLGLKIDMVTIIIQGRLRVKKLSHCIIMYLEL